MAAMLKGGGNYHNNYLFFRKPTNQNQVTILRVGIIKYHHVNFSSQKNNSEIMSLQIYACSCVLSSLLHYIYI